MNSDNLVATYLRALSTADAALAVGLFTEDAVIHSPLYGPSSPAVFYPQLFSDTSEARLELLATMQGLDSAGATTISFFFHFDWRLPSGEAAPFDVVDVARLDHDGLITSLHLVYDTVDVRPAFETATGRRSWRGHANR
ncbi:nuclear transport factor 2 family protein [uncultured Friedmanniella sp.]|uniref:nuclear transport factor 2 family protein n=1 Tax=uncultured Friedmanniella sp. TaxID=335381 RepID=UPI0035CB1DD3